MNRMNRKKFRIRRKENINKKLVFQVVFSIALVSGIIVSKKFETDFSKQIISITDEKINNDLDASSLLYDIKTTVARGAESISEFVFGEKSYAAPVSGKIAVKYGLDSGENGSIYNHGIDIISSTKSVLSISDGVVTKIGNNEKLQNYIVIEGNNEKIIYGKIKEIFVEEKDTIYKGDILGALDGEEKILHLEVWKGGESVNPEKLFKLKN